MGDEIGMANIRFNTIEDYRDIETLAMYRQIKNNGGNLDYFMEGQKSTARDNARTPFQWSDKSQAGFTSGKPWIKLNPDAAFVNAAMQETNDDSVLNYFRKIIRLRKELTELVYGKYELIEKDNNEVYAYTRTLNSKKVLVALNFSNTETMLKIPVNLGRPGAVLITNGDELTCREDSVELHPYQAAVIRLQ
jgi:oligo-1,6-glucosidase